MKNYLKELLLWIKETKIGKLIAACVLAALFTSLANVWFPFLYVSIPFWLGLVVFTLYAIYQAFKNTFNEW